MIWAVDLDNSKLDALRAISNSDSIVGSDSPFTLVDLDRLFPAEILPPKDAVPKYGLVNYGKNANSGGQTDPAETAFGFLLVAGESHAVSSLKKRQGEPEPLVFLDCPRNVLDVPGKQTQTARVVCLSDDLEGCFRVMERGVNGTLVEMPDNVSLGA